MIIMYSVLLPSHHFKDSFIYGHIYLMGHYGEVHHSVIPYC